MFLKRMLLLAVTVYSVAATAHEIVWFDGQHPITYQVVGKTDPVVTIALQMFADDMQLVTTHKALPAKNAAIRPGHAEDTDISAADSQVRILVIPTNEEIAIARDTLELVSK